MIKIEKISKVFGTGQASVTALHEVSFSIFENEFFTLLGPSGCGKTTLLRMIAGFEPPSGGALVLDGTDISQMPPNRRPVNTVFQNYALFPHMTVAENIAFGLQTQKRPKAEIAETVKRTLAQVRMEHLKDRKTSQLSGGQQQRVALARAMAPRPRILLLDEPLSALDLKLRKEMQIELKRLQHETGLTFIFVTHDQEEALTMSDRIAVMSGGHVHQIATPRELYEHPADRFVAGFIGETNFLKAYLVEIHDGLATVEIEKAGRLQVPTRGQTYAPGPVTLMVRPEHLSFGPPRETNPDVLSLPARIGQLVYLGTDTHVHVTIPNGAMLTARVQNDLQSGPAVREGEIASLVIPLQALRLVQE